MADKAPSLQDLSLNDTGRGKIPVTLFLMTALEWNDTHFTAS